MTCDDCQKDATRTHCVFVDGKARWVCGECAAKRHALKKARKR